MVSLTESLSKFVNAVGEQVSITFKSIDDFIDLIITFFVSLGFWTSIFVFILLFLLLISSPLIISRYWTNITEQYSKWTDKVFSSISNK